MKITILLLLAMLSAVCFAQDRPAPREYSVSTAEELKEAVKSLPWTGGKITLMPGEYVIKETLSFSGTSFLTIEGAGASTVIKKEGNGDLFLFEGNCWHDTIRDLVLEGDPKADVSSGIVFTADKAGNRCGCVTVEGCRLTGFAQSGLRFEGDRKNPQSSNTVIRCWFQNNKSHQLYASASNDFHIIGNQFGGSAECTPLSGCFLDGCSAGTYTMNYHWDNGKGLVLGSGSNFDRIENNRFEESRSCGLQIGDENGETSYDIITGNTIHTNSKNNFGAADQVAAFNANNITFTNNQLFSWNHLETASRNALFLSDTCREWIIKDNIFRHFTQMPVVYDKNGKHIIKDNITGERVKK
ncbi:MAG: right-handed parallel beta-helix repeat-containing protein [Abditibacteriota bacterium]|nr:right-handed parallel beta-helix repeat-containing protein [Abditibacteriota bacterium]